MRIHRTFCQIAHPPRCQRLWAPSRRAAPAGAAAPPTISIASTTAATKRCSRSTIPRSPSPPQHQITLHGETIEYTAHVGFMPIQQATSGVTEGPSLLRLLFEERRHRQIQAAGLVPVQRRTGRGHVWLHMGAFGPKMVKMAAERHGHAAAVHLRRQSQLPARYRRPGLHRRHGHGLQPPRQAQLRPRFRRRGERSGGFRRIHPQLPERIQPVGLAALCRRRKLRHHARGGPCGLPYRPRHSDQRRDAAFGGDRRQRRRRRTAPVAARCPPKS